MATSRAFIGAEGYGAMANGWRDHSNCQILFVTNLNDSGAGSFRQAFQNTTGPRIIIFQVAGYIPVNTELSNATTGTGNVYIAGQTAPGDGVTFKGQSAGTNNGAVYLRQGQVCCRYIRNRGTAADGNNNWAISFWGLGSLGNYIVDHCSLSYITDDAHANLPMTSSAAFNPLLNDAGDSISMAKNELVTPLGMLVGDR